MVTTRTLLPANITLRNFKPSYQSMRRILSASKPTYCWKMPEKILSNGAELIGNLVQSISVIPEAIVRDVYIKECAQLLHVEDKLLVSEVAKRRETQAEKRAEQTERDRRIAERTASMAQQGPERRSRRKECPHAQRRYPVTTGGSDAGYAEASPPLHKRITMLLSFHRKERKDRSSINSSG